MEGHITTLVSLRSIRLCRHIFINNVLKNRNYVSLGLESIKQHFDKCNHSVYNLKYRLLTKLLYKM